jgi:transglutaminase-like putative cysteine protease
MAAPRASIAVSVTRAGLTLASVFALTRVFAGRSWLFVMVLAAVLPPALLAWAARRHWHALVRLAVVAVAGTWLAAIVADPKTTGVLGIPSRTTLAELGHALGRGPHTLRAAVVPVSPTGSALVLAFVGVFVAAALSHWIATSLDAPVGAFAPSIALFIVVAAIGNGAWVAPTALYALASLGYLLALAQHDLVTRRTWFHASRPRGSRVASGGVLVGALAVALSLSVGPSVPGAGGSPLLDYRALGRGAGEGNLLSAPPPILSIKDKLSQGPVQQLFTVKAPRAAYWRVIALDWFTDDNAWGINKATEQTASRLSTPSDLPQSTEMQQQFRIGVLDPHWLPAAYRPVGINLTAARVVPDSLTLLVDSKAQLNDLVYDVTSQVPTPTERTLQAAPFSDRTKMARDLELPADFSARVNLLARSIVKNANTPYARAVAIQQFFRSGEFKYTLDTHLGDSPDELAEFLLETKAGFCEQFAASFAALARVVGVPARVAVGYQPGDYRADGLFHVTNRNAHAWPEVWIEGVGWIPFEPTPGFKEPTIGIGTGGPQKLQPATTTTTAPTGASTPTAPLTLPTFPRIPGGNVTVQPRATKHAGNSTAHNVTTGILIGLAAIALVVVMLLVGASFTVWQRTRRRRGDNDPRRRVLGAWAEALDQLRIAGVPPRPSATSLEFALRYAPAHGAGDAGPALMELAHLQSAAMYARDEPSEDEASFAWEQVDTIRGTIRRNVARSRRWRNLLRRPNP